MFYSCKELFMYTYSCYDALVSFINAMSLCKLSDFEKDMTGRNTTYSLNNESVIS